MFIPKYSLLFNILSDTLIWSLIGWLNQPINLIILILQIFCFNCQFIKGWDLYSKVPRLVLFLSCIVFQIIVLRSFSFDGSVVDCWLVCSHWSVQHSLILILVLGCDRKLSVERVQSGYMYLLHPHDLVRLWQGLWSDLTSCWF